MVRNNAAIRPSMRHDTAQEAHDTVGRAATRSGPARDTTRRSARAAYA